MPEPERERSKLYNTPDVWWFCCGSSAFSEWESGSARVEYHRSLKFSRAVGVMLSSVPPIFMVERTLEKDVCGERMYILNREVVDSKQSIATMTNSREEPVGVDMKRNSGS